jgi:hypothetical protein
MSLRLGSEQRCGVTPELRSPSELLHLDLVLGQRVAKLARRDAQEPRCFGLHPAALLGMECCSLSRLRERAGVRASYACTATITE